MNRVGDSSLWGAAGTCRALVADADATARATLVTRLRQRGFAVTEVQDASELIDELEATVAAGYARYDVIIADVDMPNSGGLDALAALGGGWGVPLVLMADAPRIQEIGDAPRPGAAALLQKPCLPAEIAFVIERAPHPPARRAA